MKKLSVIIPVYNVEKYIEACIESIVNQLSDNYEVIIVDDGSCDRSIEKCAKYLKYSTVKMISQENKGLSAARNVGINAAEGKYILFLDADDYLAENSLNIIDNRISSGKDFYFMRSKSFLDGESQLELNQIDYSKLTEMDNPQKCFLELNKSKKFWFAAWLVIINREFLIRNNLYFREGIYHEDELWVPQVFLKAKSIDFINEALYCYRTERVGSIIATNNIKKETDKFEIISQLSKEVCVDLISKEIVNSRCAALEFGMIENYKNVKEYDDGTHYKNIVSNLSLLKNKKYYIVYFFCKVFGVERFGKII